MQKYSVDRVVGEGSFGKALLCKRKADGRKCIVKEISLSKMSRQEAKATEQESALLARLQHPNIVSFWESFNEVTRGKSNLYIVMDFADGGDLSDLIKNRRNRLMSETQVINIAVQISLAMKHVHDRKILHRDLKSGNIFLTKSGVVKLGDFGIARVLRNTGELASTQIGTPYFMSPEILQNKRYNSKTDIWSLGCVFFELAALKVPFSGTSMKQLVSNIVRQATPRISSQYSKEFSALLNAMLAKNPKERPSVNKILAQPVMRNQIATILDDGTRQKEFSHTILHGDHILKAPPLVGQPLGAIKEEVPRVRAEAGGGVQPPRGAPPRPAAAQAGSVQQVNQALQEARARANAQAQAQQRDEARDQALKAQYAAGAKVREHEARRKIEEMKLHAAKLLRRKQMAEQAARDAAIQQRRERENADKMAALRKQEHARRQEKAAMLARQQEAEQARLAQYRKAVEARDKERAQAARAKVLEDRKQYEKNKRAAEELAPPPQPQGSKPVHQPPNQPSAVAVARGGVGFNIKGAGAEKRLNPRMKPSVPRQHPPAKSNDLRIDGQGQQRPRAQAQAGRAKGQAVGGGGGRIVVSKEGYGAPSAAQLRRERFERLQAKANASQELAKKRSEEKKMAANKKQQQKIAQQVGELGKNEASDSDSEPEEISFKPAPKNKNKPVIAAEKWFSDLERQMGDLKGDLNNLREAKSPQGQGLPPPPSSAQAAQNKNKPLAPPTVLNTKEKAPPPSHPPKPSTRARAGVTNKDKRLAPPSSRAAAVTPPTAQELALRKVKREEESKNLREFVREQRIQMGTPSPPPSSISASPKASKQAKAPENLSLHFSSDNTKPPSQTPKESISPSVPHPKNLSAAEAMRKKRDAERREMKKMIAEKRSEKIQSMQNHGSDNNNIVNSRSISNKHQEKEVEVCPASPRGEVHIIDNEGKVINKETEAPKTTSPSKGVKFQDFLGREYTPVTSEEDAGRTPLTSEEDAAVIDHHEKQLQMKPPVPKPKISVEVKNIIALTSTDDFELNKRTETVTLNQKDSADGNILVSSSCGDLLLSLKNQNSRNQEQEKQVKGSLQVATVVETHLSNVGDVERVDDTDPMEATNQVYEQLDPDVYEQLAEEMGEGWGDYTPDRLDVFGNKLEEGGFHDRVEVEVTERDEQQQQEQDEHAAEEFNNMLSVMQDALNDIPAVQEGGVGGNEDSDDDSTFEEEELDVEGNRIHGTFGGGDDELDEVVTNLQQTKGQEDSNIDDDDDDDESLGSSWGGDDESPHSKNYDDDNDDDDDAMDFPPPAYISEHDMTVYGVPFPINTGLREESDGMNLNSEDSAACRMEYIREFLEDALGEENFVQAYRLLKSVDIVDEDLLLEQMENIVGTDGLKHMGIFIQLITIEEKFENL